MVHPQSSQVIHPQSFQVIHPQSSQVIHQQTSQAPAVSLQSSADPIQVDLSLVVPYFLPTDDPLECLNKALTFMSTILALSYPSSNNQLKTSNDHITRLYTQLKKIQCLKQQMLLAQLQEAGIQLSKDQLVILADTGEIIDSGLGAFTVTTNELFQADGVKVYDSDCDDIHNAQPSFMANISSSDSDVLAKSVEIDRLKQTLSEQLKEKEFLMQIVTLLKNDFKKEESQNIDREIALEKKIKQLDNIKDQQLEPKLYDGNVIKNTSTIVIPDSEKTIMLAEESHFEKCFVPQTELSTEQAFWSQNSMNFSDPSPSCRPTKVEVPKELPKVSMVNTSLKKLKHHLAGFDVVVKERTTATAITEGSWGFEHTKSCFRDEIIPFVKALKDLFNTFNQYLIDELFEVQNVFHQMEQAVEQHLLE
ncbi:hypothetical protein Tco_0083423 [Tanacetum coccineum]